MATKVCRDCGRELPEEMFKMHRSGSRNGACRECVGRKSAASRKHRQDTMAKRIAASYARAAVRDNKQAQFYFERGILVNYQW